MLTEDTCVTEPVDTAQRERTVKARQEAWRGGGGGSGEEEGWAPAIGPNKGTPPTPAWWAERRGWGACQGCLPLNSSHTWKIRTPPLPRELTAVKGTQTQPIRGCRKQGDGAEKLGSWSPQPASAKNNLLFRQGHCLFTHPPSHADISICTLTHIASKAPNEDCLFF